jgi:hypothetical protein
MRERLAEVFGQESERFTPRGRETANATTPHLGFFRL